MPTYTKVFGTLSQAEIADRIHALSHGGRVEVLLLGREDTLRRRLRGITDKGTEVMIALDRSEQLTDGAVLSLDPEKAIVVRMHEERWLRLEPRDADAALETGYFTGNLHWRVRFEPGAILVAMEGPAEHYLERLAPLTSSGKVAALLP
jgi:urease accessory protein